MAKKRSQSQGAVPGRKRQSLERADPNQHSSTQFVKEKKDVINDCLLHLLAQNSTLLPVKKNDVLHKFGEKISRKDKNAVIKEIKTRLLTLGVCMQDVDGGKFILVNSLPRSLISEDASPDRQLLCCILSIILFNRGSLQKNELENCLSKLGIDLQTSHPYFGNINKSLHLFERQLYLKKNLVENTVYYEWGIRANCEVDKEAVSDCFHPIIGIKGSCLPQIDLDRITPPEDNVVSDHEEEDDP